MASNGFSSGVSIIAFAGQALASSQWAQHLDEDLVPVLSKHLGNVTSPIECQPLSKQGHGTRVHRFDVSTSKSLDLAQCSALSKSEEMIQLQAKSAIEYVIQPSHLMQLHRQPGLAVFDMDSTLIQQEVIDELARAVGLYDKVAAITEAAMRGEAPYTDFEASLRARAALLKGVPTDIWDKLKSSVITFTPGAKELVTSLKALGWKTAVLSGGFTPLARWVQETLGLDYAYANHLVADEQKGILTGELVPGKPIIHAEKKRELLREIAVKEGILVDRAIAVGDGSNDLLMMGAAGLGIAFNAKPKVQNAAPVRLNSATLLDVMHILGYTEDEIHERSVPNAS